jgi:hypothetical protein
VGSPKKEITKITLQLRSILCRSGAWWRGQLMKKAFPLVLQKIWTVYFQQLPHF